MKKQAFITWEHGDADGETDENYEIKDVDSFLNFIAEIRGYKVTNPYQVSVQPNNLPLKGFSPRNQNLPSDV